MQQPRDSANLSNEVGQRIIDKPELPPQGFTTDSEVYTEIVAGEMQLKRGTFRHFEVLCDEPPRIGGTDKYPSPMSYMAMALGFWLLTQVARYAHMMKMTVTKASCKVRFRKFLGGSVLKGTYTTAGTASTRIWRSRATRRLTKSRISFATQGRLFCRGAHYATGPAQQHDRAQRKAATHRRRHQGVTANAASSGRR